MTFIETVGATFTGMIIATLAGQIIIWWFKRNIEPHLDLAHDKIKDIIKKIFKILLKGILPKNKTDINKISKKRIKT